MLKKKAVKTVGNLAELARLEGVARSTTTRWDASGAVAWNADDRIDVAATRALVREYTAPTSKTDSKLAALRAKNLAVEIKIRELRLRQREGELLEKDEVDFALRDLFVGLRQQFRMSIPKLVLIASACDGSREAMAKVDDQMHDILYNVFATFHMVLLRERNKPSEIRRMVREAWASFGLPHWTDHLEKQIAETPGLAELVRRIDAGEFDDNEMEGSSA